MKRTPEPGEVLASGRVGGVEWCVRIVERDDSAGAPIRLCGEIRIPAYLDGRLVHPYALAFWVSALGTHVGPYWGYSSGAGYRFKFLTREGDSMRILRELVSELTAAATEVESAADWNRRAPAPAPAAAG